jgi:hypothetical protein
MFSQQIREAIANAAGCGITVDLTLAEDEDSFHLATAWNTVGEGHKRACLRTDPLKAIAGAIDALVGKPTGTQLQ